jgi:hypothetical protein
MPKNAENYECKDCGFICSKLSNYTTHIHTRKHQIRTNSNEKMPKNAEKFCCDTCSREFKSRSSLWYHSKRCQPLITASNEDTDTKPTDITQIAQLFHAQLQENKELKQILLEQTKQMMELSKQTHNTITHHNTTTNHHHNQKFNLNFFLNTTCKDAINMSDFIQTIEVQMNELENIGHNGYVAGMTDIILSRIKDLDICKRPVHCTDLKRETMYIKDQDEWNKDTAEKSYLRKAISMVAKKNYGKTIEWRECNPECLEVGSPKYDFCFKMMRNVLGDFEDVQFKLDNKIIKSLAKEVVVDR